MDNIYELLKKDYDVKLNNDVIILNNNIYINKFDNYLRFEMFNILNVDEKDYYDALEFVNEANQELKIIKLYILDNVNLIAYIKINDDLLNMVKDLLLEIEIINNMI